MATSHQENNERVKWTEASSVSLQCVNPVMYWSASLIWQYVRPKCTTTACNHSIVWSSLVVCNYQNNCYPVLTFCLSTLFHALVWYTVNHTFVKTATLIAYSISLPKAKFLQCIDITSLQLPITTMKNFIITNNNIYYYTIIAQH